MLDDINESFLECKHKHMIKSGAPLNNIAVLNRLKNFMVSQVELISKGYHTLVPSLISIFFYSWYALGLFKGNLLNSCVGHTS